MVCNLCSYDNSPDAKNCKRCGKKLKQNSKYFEAKKILIVEDNSYIRLMVHSILTMEGFNVIEAGDGQAGVNRAIEEMPDIILMDILLPIMNGIDAISILKQDPRTKNIPVLAVSCLDTRKDVISAIKAGCNDYLKKPITPDSLLEKIKGLLPNKA